MSELRLFRGAQSRRRPVGLILLVGLLVAGFLLSGYLLGALGQFLVRHDPAPADAAVVLHTGVDYYPRLMEAARLYQAGQVRKIVINGDRKTDALRQLESQGYEPAHPWYQDALSILRLLGVPATAVMHISIEQAYDTITEARRVLRAIEDQRFSSLIVTTSAYHSRRAAYIWEQLAGNRYLIHSAAAPDDGFEPEGWWHQGRQVRWVLSEYGAFVYALFSDINPI